MTPIALRGSLGEFEWVENNEQKEFCQVFHSGWWHLHSRRRLHTVTVNYQIELGASNVVYSPPPLEVLTTAKLFVARKLPSDAAFSRPPPTNSSFFWHSSAVEKIKLLFWYFWYNAYNIEMYGLPSEIIETARNQKRKLNDIVKVTGCCIILKGTGCFAILWKLPVAL